MTTNLSSFIFISLAIISTAHIFYVLTTVAPKIRPMAALAISALSVVVMALLVSA